MAAALPGGLRETSGSGPGYFPPAVTVTEIGL